jgi:hypothetical protein
MIAEQLNWKVQAAPDRMMRRLRKGRYEGICKNGKRVRIDAVDSGWELYMGQKYLGSWPLKRTALQKANALLTSEQCDEDKR